MLFNGGILMKLCQPLNIYSNLVHLKRECNYCNVLEMSLVQFYMDLT